MKHVTIIMMIHFAAGFGLFFLNGCSSPYEPERVSIAKALSSIEDIHCFEKADGPINMEFPRDSGAHEGFRTEWWYYTGNLKTEEGRHFGYQLTFFRQALSCETIDGESKWRTRQMYFAHFALTDSREKKFYSDLRMNRQSLGIAGAKISPYIVWIDDWRVEATAGGGQQLTAKMDALELQLVLHEEKPIIFQGENGLSRKGKESFNASYYYSMPRLKTTGDIRIGAEKYSVSGKSWFDHEWSTSALNTNVAGWDWFSVHLDDGRDLMVCEIRKKNGQSNGYGFGSISFPDGRYEILSSDAFRISPKLFWTSPETGRKYPVGWEINLPSFNLSLNVKAVIPNQEHTHMFPYWEGAARFSGENESGFGYVELTGY